MTAIVNNNGNANFNDRCLIRAFEALPIDYWDFKDENVREYTHGIHNYPAMMVCPISRNILTILKKIMPVRTLLDPFAGSGTVLVEGMLAGIPEVYGNDINPLALFISKVKTTPLDLEKLRYEVQKLMLNINENYHENQLQIDQVDEIMRFKYELDLTAKQGWGTQAPVYLREYVKTNFMQLNIPEFKNIGYWFKPRVILLLSLIKTEMEKIADVSIRNFVFTAYSETIRFVSNRRNGEFKMFRMPAEKVEHFSPDVIKEFSAILNRNVEKMDSFVKELSKNAIQSKVQILHSDAADLSQVHDESIDVVITSPPYGDSRTTVAYGEYSRLSLQWLELDKLSEKEIMGIDKSLMGGKKYNNGFVSRIKSETLRKSLARIQEIDLARAGDVYSFYFDLEKAIETVAKKTKKDGYQFWVVGNRTVKGELLKTDEIIAEIASCYHMEYVYTVGRNIINKVMPSQNSPTNEAGQKSTTMTNEHIVILRKK